MSKRKYLYLVVTKYPFQGGEPFLEEELRYLSEAFEKVHIIVPEAHRIKDKTHKYEMPKNTELHVFETIPNNSDKLFGLMSVFSKHFSKEREFIGHQLGQSFSLFHVKTWIGFFAMAKCFQRQFNQILKAHDYNDSSISIYSYWFFYATAGIALLKEKNHTLNCITRIHGWDCFFERSQGNYLPARPFVADVINGIYSISKAGLDYTKTKLPLAQNIRLAYLGIKDIEIDIKIENNTPLKIISLAFIDPVKRLDRIVDALELIDNIDIEWTHIGGSPTDDLTLIDCAREKLEGKSNVVYNFKGSITQQEVYEYFKNESPDVLICTSQSEGLPVSMMEAQAHAIPIISVNVGGISEIVEENTNGFLIPSESGAIEIAKAIENFARLSKEEKLLMKKNSTRKYQERFKASRNYPEFINLALR